MRSKIILCVAIRRWIKKNRNRVSSNKYGYKEPRRISKHELNLELLKKNLNIVAHLYKPAVYQQSFEIAAQTMEKYSNKICL